MNTSIVKLIAVIVIFTSGAFAHSFYFKAPLNMVKMEVTKSGKFVLNDGHIYELNELEVDMVFPTQQYNLPSGKR